MGHAKRKERRQAARAAVLQADERAVLDDSAVEQILDFRLGTEDGDPVTGVRNAILASVAFWVALGLLFIYL